jgi:hypothetical protein
MRKLLLSGLLLLVFAGPVFAAARTFDTTGDWSDVTKWDGDSSTPVTGDTVTIATGVTCTYDVDEAASVVLGSLTITGTLNCKTTGGPYSLAVSGNIAGAGTFNAGSSGTPLPVTTVFTIELGAAGKFLGTGGLVINFYCSHPTNKFVYLDAASAGADNIYSTAATAVDLTTAGNAPFWAAGLPIAVVDLTPEDYQGPGKAVVDQLSIVSVTYASSQSNIDLTDGADNDLDSAIAAGSQAFAVWRNIDIQFGTAGAVDTPNTYVFDTFTNAVLGCSIRPLGRTVSGRGLSTGANCTFSGTISGCSYGVNAGSGHTNSGTISGCSYGFISGSGHTNSGTISGCTYGFNAGSGHTNSGTISGCSYGVNAGSGHTNSGTISGCSNGFTYGSNRLVRGCTVSGNSQDIYNASGTGYTLLVGYGAKLGSTTTFSPTSGWKSSVVPVSQYDIGVFLYDLADGSNVPQIGQVQCWMPGGRVYSEPAATINTALSPDVCPTVTDTFFHHVLAQDGTAPVFLDQRIYGHKDVPLYYTCHYYTVDDAGTWTTEPLFQIIDPDYAFNPSFDPGGDEVLAHVDAEATENEWQSLTLTYTPTKDRELILRFIGLGGSTTDHAAYFRCVAIAPTWPAAANVWTGTGGYGPLSTTYTPAMRGSNVPTNSGFLEAVDLLLGVTVDDVTGSATGGGNVIVIED